MPRLLQVNVKDDLHRRIRIAAAIKDMTMTKLIIQALERELSKPEYQQEPLIGRKVPFR